MPIAARMPTRRALSRWSSGSLLARMEMKMMLSMPRTISSAVSVSSAIQTSGFGEQVHGQRLAPASRHVEPDI